MLLTQSYIQTALAEYVTAEEAALRAQWICEDMGKIGFELRLSTENPQGIWEHFGAIRQTEYVIPPSGFDINSADNNAALSGSFVTCGNLLRLSQCVKIGRKHLPAIWPQEFATKLSGREHLDTLNEIWWLKFWRGIEDTERAPKTDANALDFDWLLRVRDGLARCQINLEVKRRTGNVNQHFKNVRPTVSVSKIEKKFGPVLDNVANVAALTAFFPVANDVLHSVRVWFQKQPDLHGLLIWTESNLGRTPLLKLFKREKSWAEFLLNDPEPEDLKIAGRTAGTLCTASEPSEIVRQLVEDLERPTIYRP
jgi:hypothetical protein